VLCVVDSFTGAGIVNATFGGCTEFASPSPAWTVAESLREVITMNVSGSGLSKAPPELISRVF
jgi:hypothetical protein